MFPTASYHVRASRYASHSDYIDVIDPTYASTVAGLSVSTDDQGFAVYLNDGEADRFHPVAAAPTRMKTAFNEREQHV